jgi:hypothetical protein
MNADLVARTVPGFDARAYESRFVSTGAYFGRRGILDLEHYLELVRLSTTYPGLFYGSQGTFNLMVLHAVERGDKRLEWRELQLASWRVAVRARVPDRVVANLRRGSPPTD